MAGLDPATHDLAWGADEKIVDTRVKPAHDGGIFTGRMVRTTGKTSSPV